MNIAINGFGRIGRATLKIIATEKTNLKIVAINDLTETKTLAHLLKYDTSYGDFEKNVTFTKDSITVGGKKIKVFSEREPQNLPWADLKIDLVLECTGLFRTKATAGKHIEAGAKKVIISAPAKDDGIKTIVMGVNEKKLLKKDNIISNASCTTNSLAPVTEVIRQNFGIQKAIMTTIHSYTGTQNLIDGPHKDARRGRAAAVNIIPTTTGAAIATTKVIPSLKGKFDGMAVRVPTPVASLCDIVFLTRKNVDAQTVNNAFKKAAKTAAMKGMLFTSDEPLVSSDYIGHPGSTIVDLEMTKVVGGNLVKVLTWYDNEWGYSNRLVDLARYVGKKKFI